MRIKGLLFVAIAGLLLSGCVLGKRQASIPKTQSVQPQVTAQPETATASSVNVASDRVTVRYTDTGFDPKSVSVKAGTMVTFINDSSGKMWVASDPHPAHTNLPGFDQYQADIKGSTYTYTFMDPGEWTYHNHVAPNAEGTVVVE